jgi:uncharacterized RDD family membrane protein YckC
MTTPPLIFHDPPLPPPPAITIASLGERAAAVMADSFLLTGPMALMGDVIAARNGLLTHGGYHLEGSLAGAAMLCGAIVWFAYFWTAEGVFGTTLGKAMFGLEVRKQDHKSCGLMESFIRNALRVVDVFGFYFLGLLVALSSDKSQRIGDRVAGTIVVTGGLDRSARKGAAIAWVLSGILMLCAQVALQWTLA